MVSSMVVFQEMRMLAVRADDERCAAGKSPKACRECIRNGGILTTFVAGVRFIDLKRRLVYRAFIPV
jgi:hypothetical protein